MAEPRSEPPQDPRLPHGRAPESKRRGRPPTVDRDAVLDAARELLTSGGAEALTMRRLARRLGVSPMALYRHVDGRDGLLLALVERLASQLPDPVLPADPRARILVLWSALYDGLAEHPWLAEVLTRRRLMAPSVLDAVEEIHAALLDAGLTPDDAVVTYRVMWQFTLGALAVKAGADQQPAGARGRHPNVQEALRGAPDPGRYPTLAAAAPQWRAAHGQDTYRTDMQRLLGGLLSRCQ